MPRRTWPRRILSTGSWGCLIPFVKWISVREIGWAAYLTRKLSRVLCGPRWRGELRPYAAFHSRKNSPRRPLKNLRAALARVETRTYIEGPCRAGCFIADVNGAGGRNERRWSSWRCDADASLRLSTRRDRCDGQRTSGRVDSNALWWLSTDRERARETRDRGPLRFGALSCQLSALRGRRA